MQPMWGKLQLNQVRTVAVEQWLRSLPYAPATRAKIRNILSAGSLKVWKLTTPYRRAEDFLFPSIRENSTKPVWHDMILQKVIRPAAERAGITGKRIGWHTFRHSLGTNLRMLGVDVKVAQELLRHANVTVTLDLYTQAISSQKREANAKVVELLLPRAAREKMTQHPSTPSKDVGIELTC